VTVHRMSIFHLLITTFSLVNHTPPKQKLLVNGVFFASSAKFCVFSRKSEDPDRIQILLHERFGEIRSSDKQIYEQTTKMLL
jgi:hypothetical protein